MAYHLRGHFVCAEFAPSIESVSEKTHQAMVRKVPNILIPGESEQAVGDVMLRRRREREQY